MFAKFDGLGEQTINKIAEVALSRQMRQVEKLSVQVKIDPQQLAKGMLQSLAIDGQGLVMQSNLRMEQMQLTINEIGVHPLKALMGNIQLTQPTYGTASVVLMAQDITEALDIPTLQRVLLKRTEADPLKLQKVDCQIGENGLMAIAATVKVSSTGKTIPFAMILKPVFNEHQGVMLETVDYCAGAAFADTLGHLLQQRITQLINLKNIQIEGIELNISHLAISHGQILLEAIAAVTRFPTIAAR